MKQEVSLLCAFLFLFTYNIISSRKKLYFFNRTLRSFLGVADVVGVPEVSSWVGGSVSSAFGSALSLALVFLGVVGVVGVAGFWLAARDSRIRMMLKRKSSDTQIVKYRWGSIGNFGQRN